MAGGQIMQFRELVLESYKTEIERKLREKGYKAEDAEQYVEMTIEHPVEDLIEEILRDEKQLSQQEVVSFIRMIQKAKGVKELISKSSKRTQACTTMTLGGKTIYFPKRELTKKISSQFISDDIVVNVPQHQIGILKVVLATTPRIIVDLDKIPYIDEIRFDVRRITEDSQKLVNQFRVIPLADENERYTGVVEVIIDPQLYGEALNRAEMEASKAEK